MECPDCDGRGWNSDSSTLIEQTCDTCNGTGEVAQCSKCEGKGRVLNWTTAFEETCDRCDGAGWVRA